MEEKIIYPYAVRHEIRFNNVGKDNLQYFCCRRERISHLFLEKVLGILETHKDQDPDGVSEENREVIKCFIRLDGCFIETYLHNDNIDWKENNALIEKKQSEIFDLRLKYKALSDKTDEEYEFENAGSCDMKVATNIALKQEKDMCETQIRVYETVINEGESFPVGKNGIEFARKGLGVSREYLKKLNEQLDKIKNQN